MEELQVDWLAIVIAALLNMIIGFVWYSRPLFGDMWMRLKGLKSAEIKKHKWASLWGMINSLIIAYFLAFFQGYLNVTTVSDGVFIGFCLWLGFVATTQISAVIWYGKPLKLFFIDSGYKLFSLLVMSGVIGA